MADILIELNTGRKEEGWQWDGQTKWTRQQKRESVGSGQKAKHGCPFLSSSAAFSRDNVLHNTEMEKEEAQRIREGCKDKEAGDKLGIWGRGVLSSSCSKNE